ncbi:MAG: sulfatase, partial [Pirellulales bacterium]
LMTMRRLMATLTLALAWSAFGIGTGCANENKQPNIVFIFADDHAYQAVGAYESYLQEVVRTPNIDRLADQGMLFQQCFVTNSICGPMRAVIQTGKYSHLNGFMRNGNKFNGNQTTFPKLLQKAGYQTAVIGKWHLGEHQAPQGFDYSEVLIGQGPYYNPPMLKDAQGSGDNKQRTRELHTGYTTDIITDLTLKWLENGRDKSKPFMLMCQHKAPHREWSPKPEVFEHWKGVEIPEPPTLLEDYSQQVGPRQRQEMSLAKHFRKGYDDKTGNWAPGNLNAEQKEAYLKMFAEANAEFEKNLPNMSEQDRVRWMHQRYARIFLACIESIDLNVGRVLEYLDEHGLADNTIVIYTSDQGFYIGEHGWYDKRWVYEESLRTPFIVRWPGQVKPGSKNGDIVSPLDFAQTFCEIAGVEAPDDMQGRSLAPLLNGDTPVDWRKSHYYHYYEYPSVHMVSRHYAVCTERYKLLHFYGRDGDEWELVDLKVDPLETKNFYDDPNYAQVRQDLHAELERLRKQYEVPHDPGTKPN